MICCKCGESIRPFDEAHDCKALEQELKTGSFQIPPSLLDYVDKTLKKGNEALLSGSAHRVGVTVWYNDPDNVSMVGVHLGKTFHHVDPHEISILHLYPEPEDPGYYGPLHGVSQDKESNSK